MGLPAAVGLAPVAALLALAALVTAVTAGTLPSGAPGAGTRFRVTLAVLVQGLGAVLHCHYTFADFEGVGVSTATVGTSGASGGYGDGDYGLGTALAGRSTAHTDLSVTPWSVTLLWVAVLAVGLWALRRRPAPATAPGLPPVGADTAVRVALVGAAGAALLAAVGQPTLGELRVSTEPALAALWTFLLTLGVALLVLCRPAQDAWLAARPGWAVARRALATAAGALLATLLVAGLIVFAVAGDHYDAIGGWGVTFAGLLVLNLGVSGLGLSWGAPFKATVSGQEFHFGLGRLDQVWGDGGVAGTVLAGLGCALLVGVLAARRSRSRGERFLVAGFFTLAFTGLTTLSGLSGHGPSTGVSLIADTSLATDTAEAFCFALLWTVGGVLVGPYVLRALGGRPPAPEPGSPVPHPGHPAPAAYPGQVPPRPSDRQPPYGRISYGQQPYAPPAPHEQPQPQPPGGYDLGLVQPERLTERPPHRK
ncbi:hypothetical protein [Actinacidiphila yeochonensis]|uniref:hypothetical protein n=1 Tax=Actinacidiphila yeochonensis TaxID=89050 RepID=UPI00068E131E|nr:hypothetical protein [Actinacidiphila yeochonensis]